MVEAKRRPIRKVSSDYSSDDSEDSEPSVPLNKRSKAIKKKDKEGVVTFSDDDEDESLAVARQPKTNFYKEKRRAFTISIVVPSSIVDNA